MRITRGLTRHTRELLSRREGQSHDFKENIQSLKVEDLAAFANATGGTVLLGVSSRDGGIKIAGCQYGDKEELAVRQKAAEGDPPLTIMLSAENTSSPGKEILRVDIPASVNKPHCSPSGVYKIRDGNKNRNLRPQEMLSMFVDSQAATFVSRFREATQDLTHQLQTVSDTVSAMTAEVLRMSDDVETRLSETMARLDDAVTNSEEAFTRADESASEAQDISRSMEEANSKLHDALILLVQLAQAGGHDMPDVYNAKRAVRLGAYLLASVKPGQSDDAMLKVLNERVIAATPHYEKPPLTPAEIKELATPEFAKGRASEKANTRLEPPRAAKNVRRKRSAERDG